jgi:hypothetical protein
MPKPQNAFLLILVSVVIFFSFTKVTSDLDPQYIQKFGYGSICVSDKGYPKVDKYDESQFDFKNGKFYIDKKSSLNLRAILPEGKKYQDFLSDFISRRPDYKEEDAAEKIIWRVFASHDVKGNKIYASFPPANSEMLNELAYMTSEKELAFVTVDMSLRQPEVRQWETSGVPYGSSDLVGPVENWLNLAKSGWQLYIVHTVGYLQNHQATNNYIVDDPIITAIVEIK